MAHQYSTLPRLALLLASLCFGQLPALAQTTVGGNAANSNIATAISSGPLTKVGTNLVSLSANSTYTGGTLISGGTLQIGTGGSTGTLGGGDVTNNATLLFSRNNDNTIANNISGSGSVVFNTVSGTLAYTLSGSNTYTGGTLISNANTWVRGTVLSLPGNITNNGQVRFIDTTDGTYAGTMSGSGKLIFGPFSGAGQTLTLSGTNTYTGGTEMFGERNLRITTASLQGTITNDASTARLIVDQETDGTLNTQFIGAARLVKSGAGTVTLGGSNVFTNSITISNGGLVGTTSILRGSIISAGQLEFAQATNGTNTGGISGAGSVVKSGAGTVTLAAANSFTGPLRIEGGQLALGTGGSLNTNVVVDTTGGGVFRPLLSNAVTIAGIRGDSGRITLSNTNTLILNMASNSTYGGTVAWGGDGSKVIKTGVGTLTFTGTNIGTSFGEGLVISNGWVVGNVDSLNNNTTIANTNSGVHFVQTTNGTFNRSFQGNGTLLKTGAGTLTIAGNAFSITNTFIAEGAMSMTNTMTFFGSGTRVTNNGQILLNNTAGSQHGATISGTGSVISRSGGAVLVASNSYTGGTFLEGGTLGIGNVYATGPGTIAFNGGTLNYQATNAAAFDISTRFSQDPGQLYNFVVTSGTPTFGANLTSVGGSLSLSGGNLTLAGTNTYDGGTTITGNGFLFGTTTSLPGNFSVASTNAALVIDQATNGTFAGTVSGVGQLRKFGAGTVTLTGENTYTGGTLVNQGLLIVSTASLPTASLPTNSVNVANSVASLEFAQSTNGTFAGAIFGNGSLVKSGAGTLTLTASNSYANATTVSGGTLRIGDGGTNGTLGRGSVTVNATLAFDRSDNISVSNFITGTGSVVKYGAGTLTLTNTNTYTGGTVITAGTLATSTNNRLSTNGAVEVQGGGALALGGAQTVTALTGSGAVVTPAQLTVVIGTNSSSMFAGQISGVGSLVKSGAGTFTLSGDNSYGGGTVIGGGTLQVGDGGTAGSLGAGTVNFSALNTRLVFNRADSSTVGNTIIGSGSVVKNGAGTLTLTGNSTFSNTTTVNAGELSVNGSIANSAVSVAAGAALSGSGRVGAISGAGTVGPGNSPGILTAPSVDPSGGLSFDFEFTSLNPTYSSASSSVNDVLRLTATTPFVASLTAANAVNIYFNVASLTFGEIYSGGFFTDSTTSFANRIAGASFNYFLKDAGGSIIYGGESYRALPSSQARITVTTALTNVDFGSGSTNGQVAQFLIGPGRSALLWTGAENNQWNTSATNWQATTFGTNPVPPDIAFATDDAVYFGAAAASGGAITVEAGGVQTFGVYVTNSSGTVTLQGGAISSGGLTKSGAGNLVLGSGLVILPVQTDQEQLVLNEGSGSVSLNGSISGAARILQVGAGTMTLGASNSYTGTTVISNGTLALQADGALGAGALSVRGGTLDTRTSSQTVTNQVTLTDGAITGSGTITAPGFAVENGSISANLAGAGALVKSTAGTVTLTGNNTYSGGTAVNAGVLAGTASALQGAITNDAAVQFAQSSGSGTFSGSISGTGSVAKSGAGTVTFASNNTYSGGTLVSQGALQVGNGGTGGSLGTGAVTNNSSIVMNLAGARTVDNVFSGTGSFTKLGAGTMTLTASNTYSGATTVREGTLVVAGSLGASAVTVTNNGVLAGTGEVGALTVQSGGTISPGNSPGELTILGNSSWLGGGNYNWQVLDTAGTPGIAWDLVTVDGVLNLSSLGSGTPFNINLWSLSSSNVDGPIANFTNTQSYTWMILEAAGGITGFSASKFRVNTLAANGAGGFANALGPNWVFSIEQDLANPNRLNLVYSEAVIPEPGTWAAAALLVGGAAYMRWRQRKKVSGVS